MKKLLCLLISCMSLTAAPFPSSTWVLYSWASNGQYKPSSAFGSGGDASTFTFPQTGRNVAYPAFLTTISDGNVLGNLTGQTVTATISVSVTGNPTFRYGGQGTWNNGSDPANARLFISSSAATYSNSGYTACPTCYWWSHQAVVTISATTGTATISDTFDPTHWSDADGHFASDPSHTAAFNATVQNVRQIGLSYGGGSFFDVGLAVNSGTGTATFHLIGFDAQ